MRAVSLVTDQFTPEPEPPGAPAKIEPAPPSMANALCICWTRAFMSPPASDAKNASNGFSGCSSGGCDPLRPTPPEDPPPRVQPCDADPPGVALFATGSSRRAVLRLVVVILLPILGHG